ncbi:WD40 repeat-like protein [Linderina pennispora]|uniref:WD40 repeat-like protein n=1 Tax=Linderina pennispora TaxID=61395 RepID=A0A1Y1WBP8_9FUNG|nr:WD40 repeat-like protein [Linderina pennispora]ORX70953.1 WD40 repeat-like protein [Linderina pennispora]
MSIRYPHAFTSMSISPYNRDVVAGVTWCPSTQQHSWVGTTVNQTLLIYDLAHTSSTPFRDIAWAPKIPSWIGTASIDPIIKIWDVRQDQKPMWYYSEWESVDLLAFSNTEMTKLASVHRNKIAVQTVDNAHMDDITSICWHPWESNILLTGSQDKTVKKLRLDGSSVSEVYTHTFPYEVMNAKFTPFGEGVLVKLKAPDNNMLLARDNEQMEIVHRFVGHTDRVLASEWRSRGEIRMDDGRKIDTREFQLVSWGRDEVLRMWSVNDKTVESVGSHPDRGARQSLGNPVPSFSANFLGPDQLLHLMDQKILPRELLQAVAKKADLRGAATFHEFMSKENLLDSHMHNTDRSGRLGTQAAAAQSQLHSSDDDDDDFETGYRGSTSVASWREEVYAIINEKYSRSGTIVNSDVSVDARRCILTIGVPWLTSDTLRVRLDFPTYYPQSPLHVEIQKAGLVYGNRDTMQNRLRKPALEQCLYTLVSLYIAAVQDVGRLPSPPSPLVPDTDGFDDAQGRLAMHAEMPRHLKSRLTRRSLSRDTKESPDIGARSISPGRLSDDNNSVLSANRDDMGEYSDRRRL